MSNKLLEDSIADAKVLKEAALKNAESILVDKYHDKIQEAVENILEQDEDEFDDELSSLMGDEEDIEGVDSEVGDEVPLAAVDGERLCPCAEEEEEIEINFDELEQQMLQDEEVGDLGSEEMLDREEVADEFDDEEELMLEDLGLDEDELKEMCGDDQYKEKMEEEENKTLEEEKIEKICPITGKPIKSDRMGDPPWANDDEELELDEEEIKELAEELNVDLNVEPDGWLGSNRAEKNFANDAILAKANDTKVKEELENYKKSIKELEENKRKDRKKINKVIKENKEIKQLMKKFAVKLKEVNLTNAKLIYTNRILKSDSLNERQKDTIVEAIQKAESVDNVKVYFETLQEAVGRKENKSLPKSLLEVTQRRSSTVMPKSKNSDKKENSKLTRMQVLAGLKKK